MAKTHALPTSDATNAYDLLSDVIRIIREEPTRYSQHDWLVRPERLKWDPPIRGVPACGTIGCIAGWIHTLRPRSAVDVPASASATLGLPPMITWALFQPSAVKFSPQTRRHAWSGARHIRRFQRRYKQELLAKAV